MGLFARKKIEASSHGTAAIASGGASLASLAVGAGRDRAMALPTISRGRDLLAALIGSLPIRQYGTAWNGEDLEEIPLPPEPWMRRPDPRVTRSHIVSWTFDDALFTGRGYWYVTRRYADTGFPAAFTRLPAALTYMQAQTFAGNVPLGDYSITFNGSPIPTRDVIVFYSPMSPLLEIGARAISTSERLDDAALRFASTPAAFGWLEQTEGDSVDADFLEDVAQGWQDARDVHAVAALGRGWKWNESTMDPSRLQLVEARQHQALELARLVNVSPFLVGAPSSSGMTYQNAEQARMQLAQDALPFIEMIEQTLSADEVTPRGRVIRLDRSEWTTNHLEQTPAEPAPAPAGDPA